MRGIRIPGFLLRDRIQIEDHSGGTAYGPSYAASRTIKARVESTTRLTIDRGGNNVRAEAIAYIRPEAGPVPVESRVTWGGKTYRVLAAGAVPDERRPTHRELLLGFLS